jgi:hypothetical protein
MFLLLRNFIKGEFRGAVFKKWGNLKFQAGRSFEEGRLKRSESHAGAFCHGGRSN